MTTISGEKLVEQKAFSLSRETRRRLLRQRGIGSPRKRCATAHRQRRLRSARLGELVQLDVSPYDWLDGRGPGLTALGRQDDATGKILAAQFFPCETAFGYLCSLRQLLRRFGVPLAFYGDHSRDLRPQRRLLDGGRTTRWKTPAHLVRSRTATARLHRR